LVALASAAALVFVLEVILVLVFVTRVVDFALVTVATADADALPSAPHSGNFANLPCAPRQLSVVSSLELLPSPLLTPLYSLQTALVVPQEPEMVAESPKLELMPMRSDVMPKARTFSTTTWRGDLDSLSVQSPQERYSLPALTTVKSLIFERC
tara:strand:- start:7338 stop:7799 length:462 start_codon:yes stop_codon:yes gene_type:complete